MTPAYQIADEPSNQQIALAAYQIWELEGRPDGRAVEHWFEAEARLRPGARTKPASKTASGASAARAHKAKRQSRYGLVLNGYSTAS